MRKKKTCLGKQKAQACLWSRLGGQTALASSSAPGHTWHLTLVDDFISEHQFSFPYMGIIVSIS